MEIKDWTYEEFPEYSEEVEDAKWIESTGNEIAVRYIPNVVYAEPDGIPLKLQMLIPSTRHTDKIKSPTIVFVQGSGWFEQDVYVSLPQYSRLALRGYVVAIVQYRHSGQAKFPSQIQDARAAARFLISHAEEYGVDVEKMFIAGDSSGGHTAMFAGIAENGSEFDYKEDSEIPLDFKGIINHYGSVSLLKKEDTPNTTDYEEDTSPGARVSGCKDFWHSMEAREKLSVVSYITDKTKIPPVFITHGTKDFIINTDCSVQLYKKLKECGKDARLFIVKGAIHSDPAFWTEELIDYMDEFIKYCLEKNRDENQGDQQ